MGMVWPPLSGEKAHAALPRASSQVLIFFQLEIIELGSGERIYILPSRKMRREPSA